MNPFGNIKLVGAVLISGAVLAAAVLVPQLQMVFSTVTPDAVQLIIALGFSAAAPLVSSFLNR